MEPVIEQAQDSLERYKAFPAIQFERPAPGVLRMTLDGPNYNAVDAQTHRDLATVWLTVDQDPETRVVVITGAGKAFSAGGSLELVDELLNDFGARTRVLREARDIVMNIINCSKLIVSAINGPAIGSGLVPALLADVSIAGKAARIMDGHTKIGVAAGDHAAICWPLLCGMAKAKYHLLTCDRVTGEEAERIGLVSLCVEDAELQERALAVATQLASGSQSAMRWTKHTLNNWYRMAGPMFDASLAFEFYGWNGPDAIEGIASIKEGRAPVFTGPASE